MHKITDNYGKNHFMNFKDFKVLGIRDSDDLVCCTLILVRSTDKVEVVREIFNLTAEQLLSALPEDSIL